MNFNDPKIWGTHLNRCEVVVRPSPVSSSLHSFISQYSPTFSEIIRQKHIEKQRNKPEYMQLNQSLVRMVWETWLTKTWSLTTIRWWVITSTETETQANECSASSHPTKISTTIPKCSCVHSRLPSVQFFLKTLATVHFAGNHFISFSAHVQIASTFSQYYSIDSKISRRCSYCITVQVWGI